MNIESVNVSSKQSVQTRLPAALVKAIVNALNKLDSEMQRRRSIWAGAATLRSMPDHMLHDFGIRRSEIDYVVRYGRDIDRARTKEIAG